MYTTTICGIEMSVAAHTFDWCQIGVAKRDKRLHLANIIKIGHRVYVLNIDKSSNKRKYEMRAAYYDLLRASIVRDTRNS